MRKRKKLAILGLTGLILLILPLPSSTAESDKTRKIKAEAEHYFDKGEYYKAIDNWAEVIKIDSYDKEALLGITKAQEIIEESKGEKEKDEKQKLRELIQEGKNYSRDRDYKKALSSWGKALSVDPTNKEVLDLIEETRIKAQYQISILDKLDKEKRVKTPHITDLNKIADRMIDLLEETDAKIRKKKAKEIRKEAKEEAVAKVDEETEFIEITSAKSEESYKEEGSAEEELRQKEEAERVRKEEEKRKRLEEKQKEKARLLGEARKREEALKAQRPPSANTSKGKQDLLIIGLIVLLALLLTARLTAGTGVKPHLAKAPPKKIKKEEAFEPRDLKKFLKKTPEDKDKDLFK